MIVRRDPHPIPPPFRGREERAARAALRPQGRHVRLAPYLPQKGGEPAPDLIRGRSAKRIGWRAHDYPKRLEPPHPDPLPAGERERAEFSIWSVLKPGASADAARSRAISLSDPPPTGSPPRSPAPHRRPRASG